MMAPKTLVVCKLTINGIQRFSLLKTGATQSITLSMPTKYIEAEETSLPGTQFVVCYGIKLISGGERINTMTRQNKVALRNSPLPSLYTIFFLMVLTLVAFIVWQAGQSQCEIVRSTPLAHYNDVELQLIQDCFK